MKRNVGKFDRMIRVIVSVVLALAGYFTGLWFLYVFAAILMATAVMRFCGLYTLLGINTCKIKK
ncbi:MAG: DUF2892 domain-containing protein [Nanoarchaeota archaeon]|nr:DUF2892 domain-containing protein [Nanoarchaeota archaeon]